ncbi:MAG TPA: flavin oxidoreductase, partial [Alcanivorax sp.]|nr:flavin oxidoreductase [Alcanivorax sp.]
MTFRVGINRRHVLNCAPDVPILTAAREAGFGFPHACRNGVCLRCQGRLTVGAVRHGGSGDIIHAHEPGADRVLYCVAIPISDCEIDVPETTAPGELPVHQVQCQIIEREPLNHD